MVAKKSLFKLLLWIFFLTLHLQVLSLAGWLTLEDTLEERGLLDIIKVYHIVSVSFLAFFFRGTSVFIPKLPLFIWHFFIFVFASSLVLYAFYVFNSFLINYFFCFYALLIGLLAKEYLTQDEIIAIFKQVSIVICSIVFIKLIYYIDELIRFMRDPWGHPTLETLYGGGVNLEATWLAFNSAFFMNSKKRYFYAFIIFALVVSLLYASRVGVVLTGVIYFFRFISPTVSSKERARVFQFVMAALVVGSFFVDFSKVTEGMYGFERFAKFNSEEDGGMEGRKAMWQHIPQALYDSNWLGYGAGNSMWAIERVSQISFYEDNPHNYYMQLILEFGIIMLVVYLILVYNIVGIIRKKRFADPFSVILMAFFIGSLIQFRGAEALIWLYIGIILNTEFQNKADFNNNLHIDNA